MGGGLVGWDGWGIRGEMGGESRRWEGGWKSGVGFKREDGWEGNEGVVEGIGGWMKKGRSWMEDGWLWL